MLDAYRHAIPDPGQWLALAAVLLAAAGSVMAGRLVAPRDGLPEAHLVVGWAVATVAYVLWGTLTALPLAVPAALLGALAVAGLLAAGGRLREMAPLGMALLLGVPLLVVLAAKAPAQWDEFSHWLINQRYLVEHDAFPRRDGPPSASYWPAYPYGLPVLVHLASRIAGGFLDTAGTLVNALLLLVLGVLLARAVEGKPATAPPERPSWAVLALGLLLAAPLNPGFVEKIAFTSYVDWTTAVVAAVSAALLWRCLEALIAGIIPIARAAAVQLAFVLALLVSLKQANVAVLGALLLGAMAAALARRGFPWRAALGLALPALLPTLATLAAWRWHVARHMPGGEFGFRPLGDWAFAELPQILASMASVAAHKGGLFGLTAVLAALTLGRLVRGRVDETGRLLVLVSVAALAVHGALFLAYLGAFPRHEAVAAASYWRYSTELSGILMLGATVAAARWLRSRPAILAALAAGRRGLASLAIALVLIGPLAALPRLRFDLPDGKPHDRAVAAGVAGLLPDGARVYVVDPFDNGFRAMVLRYHVGGRGAVGGQMGDATTDLSAVASGIAGQRSTHVWVYRATDGISAMLGRDLPRDASLLLERSGDGWAVVRSWPLPAGPGR